MRRTSDFAALRRKFLRPGANPESRCGVHDRKTSGRSKGKIMKNISVLVALAAVPGLVACSDDTEADREHAIYAEEATPAAHQVYETSGEVTALSDGSITIDHGPVEEIGWPAMTMAFEVTDPAMIETVTVSDRVDFGFRESETGYALTSIAPAAQ